MYYYITLTVTYTCISCNMHNYIPNQAINVINVAKLCFYCVFSLKIPHKCGGNVTLTLTLSFNF